MPPKREIYYTTTDTPGESGKYHVDRFCQSIKNKATVVSELTTEEYSYVACADGHQRSKCMRCG